MNSTYDVFISFKNRIPGSNVQTRDSEIAEELYEACTQRGISAFFSNRTIPEKGLTNWQLAIDAALKNSTALILVGTKADYVNSQEVRFEWSDFIRKSPENTFLLCEGMEGKLPYELTGTERLDLLRPGMALDKVIDFLKKILDRAEQRQGETSLDPTGPLAPISQQAREDHCDNLRACHRLIENAEREFTLDELLEDEDISTHFKKDIEGRTDLFYEDDGVVSFAYWPVFFNKEDFYDDLPFVDLVISTCASCFGALMLRGWQDYDSPLVTGRTTHADDQIIKSAINTMILLRSSGQFDNFWASEINFGLVRPFTLGTINSTTLSLSTLLACDYPGSDAAGLRMRSVEDSVLALLGSSKRFGSKKLAWGYMPKEPEADIAVATLPTAFAIETLVKYLVCAQEGNSDERVVREGKKALKSACGFFLDDQRHDGGFRKAPSQTESSVLHTAKAVASLVTACKYLSDDPSYEELVEDLCAAISRASGFLVGSVGSPHESTMPRFSANERVDHFDYTRRDRKQTYGASSRANPGEDFENCCELILTGTFQSLARNHDFLSSRSKIDMSKDELVLVARRLLRHVNDRQLVLSENGGLLVASARGLSENPYYPIYWSYYHRSTSYDQLCLEDAVTNDSSQDDAAGQSAQTG